jgi:type I restriction enzyme, R subunit
VKVQSPNFAFLAKHDPLLVRYAAQAERYFAGDPNTCLFKLRQFGETLAKQAAGNTSSWRGVEASFVDVLNDLASAGALTPEARELFHDLRRSGNAAAHGHIDTHREALHQLKAARRLAIWFHKAFGGDPSFKPGPFVPPPDPGAATEALQEELEALRASLANLEAEAEESASQAAQEAAHRAAAEEEARRAYADLEAAMELATETEAQLTAARAAFDDRLGTLQFQLAAQPELAAAAVAAAAQAGAELTADEAETREKIDAQLRAVGWEADTIVLRWSKGTRPMKGRDLAIAEWPTESGPVDYVLFAGLTPVAIVEAKRESKNVRGVIGQSKRYSRGFLDKGQSTPTGPWDDYRVPFLFATNGRPFLRQLKDESGIWFLDARLPTNHPRALVGWYSSEGLLGLLDQDIAEAEDKLRSEPKDYLPLRAYQRDAIDAVEEALSEEQREILLAMATGTGKTRTCIALVYRLIKSGRFRRVLFLVDRSALGKQASDAFGSVHMENLQSFKDIYDVKELGDLRPDEDTRLQIATVQGMVKRLLYPGDDDAPLPVDQYDCIVIDECHRGYTLDREMSESELTFRSEADYVSKYRQVLDHFDAVKVGLTATPALHTTEIFGRPVFTYSYRQAVIDGHLIDHEPPIGIVTALAEDGITWMAGEEMAVYRVRTGQLDLVEAPDEVNVEVEKFNLRVLTENFNRVVCTQLAREIDPTLPGKTLIFCANDRHADTVVGLLKEAFEAQYGPTPDDTVMKITGAADKPMSLFLRFKNEPNQIKVAVTVDLLTTGIDVPEITNLVFIRRVRSRILFEQMKGRATRQCDDIDKEVFRIYDAVDLFSALAPWDTMKPVVVDPKVTFMQLASELTRIEDDDALREVHEQLVAKLQRKKRRLVGERADQFEALAGMQPEDAVELVRHQNPKETARWFAERPGLAAYLDRSTGDGAVLLVSEHEDELRRIERGYGAATEPDDYLESFGRWVQEHLNEIPALVLVTTRPRDLTRQQLRSLKLALDGAGYTETSLRVAWREATNQDIAASIIGFIRQQALGSPLVPYDERVDRALKAVLGRQPWTGPQRKWLERIAKQLREETVVDRASLDRGGFRDQGGFKRLNKVFDGRLDDVLGELSEAVWTEAG